MRKILHCGLGLLLLACAMQVSAYQVLSPDWSDIGLTQEKLEPGYWLQRAPLGETALMSSAAIAGRNQQLLKTEPSMVYWPDWPNSVAAEAIRTRIETLSKRPQTPLFNNRGETISEAEIDAWMDNRDLDRIKPADNRFFGLVVTRAPLRRFPTGQRMFDTQGGVDIDRLQESALFPGMPVAVLHASRDGKWLFVQAENYAAWIAQESVALASRAEVLAYAGTTPRRWISGAHVQTAYVPAAPEISELALEMGTSFPVLGDWPLAEPVNGQGALGSWVINVPVRNGFGLLRIMPVLLPRSADTAPAPLVASQANLIRQSFKFLGERYGWGHDYHARDCSGFVSEVYRSMGIMLPRNTSDQQRSQAFERIAFDPDLDRQQRIARLRQLDVGDLVFIPGHVMMVIGNDEQGPWVIHDSNRTGVLIDGRFSDLPSNGVVVTPLLPLALSSERLYADAVTAVQRILPSKP